MNATIIFNIFISLLTLSLLEIILGVDNLVFISILSHRLPEQQRKKARRIGLLLAWVTRLLLLACVVWLAGLTKPFFSIGTYAVSVRDLLLLVGGIFLLIKGTHEIHVEMEAATVENFSRKHAHFSAIIVQIALFDIVFSFDSVITAIGLVQQFWMMAVAITIAIFAMIVASEPISHVIHKYPTIKMLAFSFLLLIGMVLVADAFHFHIPRGYLYFAVCFSIFVEILNNLLAKKKTRKNSQ